MKKLMIAATLVCAASFAQAAKVDWTLNAKDSIMLQDGSRASGFNCYLIYAADETALNSLKANLAKGEINAGNITDLTKNPLYLGTGTTGTGNQTKGKIGQTSSIESSKLTAVQGAGYYDLVFVAFDSNTSGNYYYMSGVQQGQAWDDENVLHTLADAATWEPASYSSANWHAVSAVPEPTSGLLLLLGVAGLALRRRRA